MAEHVWNSGKNTSSSWCSLCGAVLEVDGTIKNSQLPLCRNDASQHEVVIVPQREVVIDGVTIKGPPS